MKKRFCALVVCVAVLLSALPALASGGSMGSFVPRRTYDGRFLDVASDSWYYDNVAYLYALGLTEGQSGTLFGADSRITIGEALSFAARVRSTYYAGDPEAGARSYSAAEGPWYTPYLQYLTASGFGPASQFAGQYDRFATRSQSAGRTAFSRASTSRARFALSVSFLIAAPFDKICALLLRNSAILF